MWSEVAGEGPQVSLSALQLGPLPHAICPSINMKKCFLFSNLGFLLEKKPPLPCNPHPPLTQHTHTHSHTHTHTPTLLPPPLTIHSSILCTGEQVGVVYYSVLPYTCGTYVLVLNHLPSSTTKTEQSDLLTWWSR